MLAVAVGLGLAEGAVRLVLPAFDPSGQFRFTNQISPTLVLGVPGAASRQRKNSGDFDVAVRINRHGLRDDLDVATAGPGDVLVLGDSVAWGWGVEAPDRFSDRLRGLLGRRVFNVSAPTDLEGYRELLAYAERLGGHPGQVVLALSMETDLVPDEVPESGQGGFKLPGLKVWLESNSAAYRLLTTVVHQTPWLRDIAVRLGLIVPNLRGISRTPDGDRALATSADTVADIARGRRMLVVLVPSRGLWAGDERDREDAVHRRFGAALQARGVEVLDLRPLMEAGGRPLGYHFANDGHWNPEGHRLAAEAIARRLRGE